MERRLGDEGEVIPSTAPFDAHAVLVPALEGLSPTPEFAAIAEANALFEATGDNRDSRDNRAVERLLSPRSETFVATDDRCSATGRSRPIAVIQKTYLLDSEFHRDHDLIEELRPARSTSQK